MTACRDMIDAAMLNPYDGSSEEDLQDLNRCAALGVIRTLYDHTGAIGGIGDVLESADLGTRRKIVNEITGLVDYRVRQHEELLTQGLRDLSIIIKENTAKLMETVDTDGIKFDVLKETLRQNIDAVSNFLRKR